MTQSALQDTQRDEPQVAGRGNDGSGGAMEERLRRVENQLARIDSQLEHVATKAELAGVQTQLAGVENQLKHVATKAWVLGGVVSGLLGGMGLAATIAGTIVMLYLRAS